MLESGEQRAALATGTGEVVADLDDRRDRLARLPEELEAYGAGVRRHPVQHPARRGDEPVAALFLHARQPTEELVGDVLAEAGLAKAPARDRETLAAQLARAGGRLEAVFPDELERGDLDFVDLAEVVRDPADLEPVAFGIDHAPPGEIVDRGAPEHGFLAAGVHRDIAADAGGVGRGRVDREHEAAALGGFGHAARDCAGPRVDGGDRFDQARQCDAFGFADRLELLDVDHRRARGQWHRAAGVAGATAARDHRQAEFRAGAHQSRDLVLAVGSEHDEGDFHPPVGRIGGVRDAREGVETQVVGVRVAFEPPARLAAQFGDFLEVRGERLDRRLRQLDQRAHPVVERGIRGVATLVDLGEPVLQRLDQQRAPTRVVEQVLFEIGIAANHPDVTEHLVEHPCTAASAALATQLLEQRPAFGAEQSLHDLAVRERGVVVGDLAQASRRIEGRRGGFGKRQVVLGSVHGGAGDGREGRRWGPSCGSFWQDRPGKATSDPRIAKRGELLGYSAFAQDSSDVPHATRRTEAARPNRSRAVTAAGGTRPAIISAAASGRARPRARRPSRRHW